MYLVSMGLFDSVKRGMQRFSEELDRPGALVKSIDSVKRGMQRFSDPLTPSELSKILDGRQQSELAGYFFGQTYAQRVGWAKGMLTVFHDGSGGIYFDFRGGTSEPGSISDFFGNFLCEASWKRGSATNDFNDPTPLLVSPSDMTFEKAKKYIPSNTPIPSPGELLLVTENFTNDYDDDGQNRWVSGASHKPGAVFSGLVIGSCAAILRQRCSGRQGW
jgi:hypothetical protein